MYAFKPTRILVPTVFDDVSFAALQVAEQIAAAHNAELVLLHAAFDAPLGFEGELMSTATIDQMTFAEAEQRIRIYADEYLAHGWVRYRTVVSSEPPVRAIAEVAEEEDVDLIVLGTHGRTGVRHFVFGSIAEAVLHETERPVLTVPAGETNSIFDRILCPVDYSFDSPRSLIYAASLAGTFGGELIVVHVIDADELDAQEARRLDEWVTDVVGRRVQHATIVRRGDSASEVLRLANNMEASMIVMGAHHARYFDSCVLGTSLARAVRHSHRPVLTITQARALSAARVGKEGAVSIAKGF